MTDETGNDIGKSNATPSASQQDEPKQDAIKGPLVDAAPKAKGHRRDSACNYRIESITLALALIAAVASAFSAISSRQQATAAVEANSEGQRAVVNFDGLRIDQQNMGDPGLPYIWFTVLVENSGNTPTKSMKYATASSQDAPGDPEELFRHPRGAVFSQRITLPPHYKGPLGFPQSGIPQSAFRQMVDHHLWYYIYGVAHYQDRFSSSAEHVSKFCFAVGANMSDASQPAYVPCLNWNCIDDDCEADKADYQAEFRKLNPNAPGGK